MSKKRNIAYEFNILAGQIDKIGELITAQIFLPAQGEGARTAVEEEANEMFADARRQLNKVQQKLISKIWEGF